MLFRHKLSLAPFSWFFTASILLSMVACVQVKKASLYDGVEPAPPLTKPKTISQIVEPLIYDEDPTDVWGMETDVCKEANVTSEVAYSGNECLQITWNRNAKGCPWAGIGIGWDGYAGKDLSSIMDFVAIQMYVRTQKGRAFGLPFVLTLEDYSGGMAFSYTSNKYFERSAIDEEWQKVVVPLNTFDLEEKNLDPTNIKQLQIELQQSGSVYLDDIRLVFYEEEAQEPWMVEDPRPDPLALPVQIFSDAFPNNNGWGLMTDRCQNIELSEQSSSEGQKSIYLKWNAAQEDCSLTAFGASWNKWFPVDLTSIRGQASIQFDIRLASGSKNALPINVGFEDYERGKKFVALKSKYVQGGSYTSEWKSVTIPLSDLPDQLDYTKIKQLYITLEKSGEVYIDNIRLVRP